ncbi:MAG: ATP-dependent helicase [Clostridia bacterium]|nr:ATP-dependent helicase [Clostridia bacterium]
MYRKGQKELITTYRNGYCGVPAIPGGGKTFALTKWVVEAIKEGINKPGKILIVTYMSSAVNNFKQRISSELEKLGIVSKDYFVCTIHSLCMQIIKENPDIVLLNEEFNVIDQSEQTALIKDAINGWKRRGENKRLYDYYLDDNILASEGYDKIAKKWEKDFANIVSNAISEFKNNEISSTKAIELTSKLPITSFLRVSAEIYRDYEYKLNKRGLIDFGDMLSKAKQILTENKSILEKFKKKYTYICEDEAQDSNKLQTDILKLIAGEDGNFLRVGDSNQAIMTTFANSDMKLFKEFCESPNTKVFNIVQSSRNIVQIINEANNFVRFVRENHPVEECKESLLPQYIEPVDEDDDFPNPKVDGNAIFKAEYKKADDEYEAIAKECENLLENFKDKTTAVLLPNRFKIEKLLNVFDSKKIKYEYLDNYAGDRNECLVTLGKILDFVGQPEKNEKLVEVVKMFISDEEPLKETLFNYLQEEKVEEIMYPISGNIDLSKVPEELLESDLWNEFLRIRDLLLEFLGFPFTLMEKLVLYIAERLNFSMENMAIAQKVASTVRFMLEEDPRYKVIDLAAELLNPKNSFNFFANLVWELKGYEAKPGVVTVATYHKSKGLEWDNVFLGDLCSEDFPASLTDKFKDEVEYLKAECSNPSRMLKEDMAKILKVNDKIDYKKQAKLEVIGERARLLYVGITRAKERLYISTVKNSRTRPSIYYDVL